MAHLTLAQFTDMIRAACDESALVSSYDVRVLDNAVVKMRIFLATASFVDVYFNASNHTCSYTLIENERRIYGADNAFIGWHIHPFGSPDEHRACTEISFGEFLVAVEDWARRRRGS